MSLKLMTARQLLRGNHGDSAHGSLMPLHCAVISPISLAQMGSQVGLRRTTSVPSSPKAWPASDLCCLATEPSANLSPRILPEEETPALAPRRPGCSEVRSEWGVSPARSSSRGCGKLRDSVAVIKWCVWGGNWPDSYSVQPFGGWWGDGRTSAKSLRFATHLEQL